MLSTCLRSQGGPTKGANLITFGLRFCFPTDFVLFLGLSVHSGDDNVCTFKCKYRQCFQTILKMGTACLPLSLTSISQKSNNEHGKKTLKKHNKLIAYGNLLKEFFFLLGLVTRPGFPEHSLSCVPEAPVFSCKHTVPNRSRIPLCKLSLEILAL